MPQNPGQPAQMGNSTAQDIENEIAANQPQTDTSSGTPTVTAGANNGTTPPAPVINAGSTDDRGSITFGSGATPAAGAQVVVSYAQGYQNTPGDVVLTAENAATQALGLLVTGISASGFTVSTSNAPAASQGNTTFVVGYETVA